MSGAGTLNTDPFTLPATFKPPGWTVTNPPELDASNLRTTSLLPPSHLSRSGTTAKFKNTRYRTSPWFSVKPSCLLKAASMSRLKKHTHGLSSSKQDLVTRLAGDDFRLQRIKRLRTMSHKRAMLEATEAEKEHRETLILSLAANKGLHWTALDPLLALALAKAVRDTLTNEEEAAKLRVEECSFKLETLRDDVEHVQARLTDANRQVAMVMQVLAQDHIHVDLRSLESALQTVTCDAFSDTMNEDISERADTSSYAGSENEGGENTDL